LVAQFVGFDGGAVMRSGRVKGSHSVSPESGRFYSCRGGKAIREKRVARILLKNAGFRPKTQRKAAAGKGRKMKKQSYIVALQSCRAAMQGYRMTPQSCGVALQRYIVGPQSCIATPQAAR
jgi:hypothetical protein